MDVSYEGHGAYFAQDTYTKPAFLPDGVCAFAVNMSFRGGKNQTRPPFREIELTFLNSEQEDEFRSRHTQGVFYYAKLRAQRDDSLIVVCGGAIYGITFNGNKGTVIRINTNDLLSENAGIVYYEQAEEWTYFQDASSNPLFWNGLYPSPAERSGGSAELQMPPGTVMVYAHGRIHLADRYNTVLSSDIIYGRGFTDTSNPQNFTETTYWAEGGGMGLPSRLGRITAGEVIPVEGQNINGDGEVIFLEQNGAVRLNVSVPRQEWKFQNIQRTAIRGRSCVAPNSLTIVNNDLWFKSQDAWCSFTQTTYGFDNRVTVTDLSRQVERWLATETKWLQKHASHIYFDRRILGTTSPRVIVSDNGDRHVIHEGLLVVDLDQVKTLAESGLPWQGLWTGLRVTGMASGMFNGISRGFIMSYDADGVNRLYEIGTQPGYDEWSGGVSKQQWKYLTKVYNWSTPGASNDFLFKQIAGSEIHLKEIIGLGSVEILYRKNGEMTFSECGGSQDVGVELTGYDFAGRSMATVRFSQPDDECGSDSRLRNVGQSFQFLVRGTGVMEIERARFGFSQPGDPPDQITTCSEDLIQRVGQETGEHLSDFDYLIANP